MKQLQEWQDGTHKFSITICRSYVDIFFFYLTAQALQMSFDAFM